jgi:3-hydroxyacyl-[acyl-carrier-protein] dehydratase
MAQTSGWLLIGLTRFTRMPFLASIKDAKLRSFVTPGQALAVSAKLVHDGSGFAVTKAEVAADGRAVASAELTLRLLAFADPSLRSSMERMANEIAFPMDALVHG